MSRLIASENIVLKGTHAYILQRKDFPPLDQGTRLICTTLRLVSEGPGDIRFHKQETYSTSNVLHTSSSTGIRIQSLSTSSRTSCVHCFSRGGMQQ